MEVSFAISKTLFCEMCNERMTFTSQDIKWKEHLLKAALKMDEDRCQKNKKGKNHYSDCLLYDCSPKSCPNFGE